VTYYATYTTTRVNLVALAAAGIRVLVGPDQLRVGLQGYPATRYAIDNGAWGAFKAARAFDAAAFWRVLERWGERRACAPTSCREPDWIVCPDIVAGGLTSLGLSLQWLPYVRQYGHPLIAVQDGMRPEHVEDHVGPGVGIFLGGSTAWKWSTLPTWATMARTYRAHLPVGRVNSERGIAVCRGHGVTSADGTAASRFSVNAPRLGRACRGPVQMRIPAAAGAK
jgi:hypothetical protein